MSRYAVCLISTVALGVWAPLKAAALAVGDSVTVHFKDGSSVGGTLLEMGPAVAVSVAGNALRWNLDSVARIESTTPSAGPPITPAPPTFSPLMSPAPMGYASPAPIFGFGSAPVTVVTIAQPLTPQQQEAFLKQQESDREARRRQVTTPESDFQFRLQQALDRRARGLPFVATSADKQ